MENRKIKINNYMKPMQNQLQYTPPPNTILPIGNIRIQHSRINIQKTCRICLETDDKEYISPCYVKVHKNIYIENA